VPHLSREIGMHFACALLLKRLTSHQARTKQRRKQKKSRKTTPTPSQTTTTADLGPVVYELRVCCEQGAKVRDGVEIDDSPCVRTLAQGDLVDAFSKAYTHERIPRYGPSRLVPTTHLT
jgi:hypothetical protein